MSADHEDRNRVSAFGSGRLSAVTDGATTVGPQRSDAGCRVALASFSEASAEEGPEFEVCAASTVSTVSADRSVRQGTGRASGRANTVGSDFGRTPRADHGVAGSRAAFWLGFLPITLRLTGFRHGVTRWPDSRPACPQGADWPDDDGSSASPACSGGLPARSCPTVQEGYSDWSALPSNCGSDTGLWEAAGLCGV